MKVLFKYYHIKSNILGSIRSLHLGSRLKGVNLELFLLFWKRRSTCFPDLLLAVFLWDPVFTFRIVTTSYRFGKENECISIRIEQKNIIKKHSYKIIYFIAYI